MSRITEEGKIKQNRYERTGGFIKTRELDSMGTSSMIRDWKTGELVYLLSQGERDLYYTFRFNPLVKNVFTQVRLVLEETNYIARRFHVRPASNGKRSMTTDFLVEFMDGRKIAVSYKNSEKDIEDRRTLEKLNIEKVYWEQIEIPYLICFRKDINPILVDNIRLVVPFFREESIYDDLTMVRHLIATHQLEVDMETEDLNFRKILQGL